MKLKLLALFSAATLLAAALPSSAQTPAPGTNSLLAPTTALLSFISTPAASNWFIAPYGIASTDHKFGAGVALGYKLSDFVAPIMRLDYFNGRVWMPSASLQLQVPIQVLGKFTAVPFTFVGLATPLSGRGADNWSAVSILGAGLAVRVSSHWDVVADIEKWSGFKGEQIRGGLLRRF